MAKQEKNDDSRRERSGRDGLSVHLPWLVVAVLGLFFLILLPRARQESLAAPGRRLVPAPRRGASEGGGRTPPPRWARRAAIGLSTKPEWPRSMP